MVTTIAGSACGSAGDAAGATSEDFATDSIWADAGSYNSGASSNTNPGRQENFDTPTLGQLHRNGKRMTPRPLRPASDAV